MMQTYKLSQRAACRLASISRSTLRYQARPRDDAKLRARLKALAVEQSACGYLLLHGILKREGLVVNRKRTFFNRAFSASSSFKRFIIDASMPPNLARHW